MVELRKNSSHQGKRGIAYGDQDFAISRRLVCGGLMNGF
jgi:hypothetical protein